MGSGDDGNRWRTMLSALKDPSGTRAWLMANAAAIEFDTERHSAFPHFMKEFVKRTTNELGKLMAEQAIDPNEAGWKEKLAEAVERGDWWKTQVNIPHLVAIAQGKEKDVNGLAVAGYAVTHMDMAIEMAQRSDGSARFTHEKGSEVLARVLFGGNRLEDMPSGIEDAIKQGYEGSALSHFTGTCG
ncbi:MAG: hypothetical protein IT567_05515 [Alphaproteobacteria bacterium]|nr:hypothetical protein [Alphaproteobacteria bacterium]